MIATNSSLWTILYFIAHTTMIDI